MKTRTSIRKNEAGATTEQTAPAATGETTQTTTEQTAPAATGETTQTTTEQTAPAATVEATAPAAGEATTEQTPNTPSMDDLAARVAEAEKGLASTHKTFTSAEFAAYVNEQLEKAKGEDAEKAGARFKALQSSIGLAKTAFEQSGSSVSIPVYHDPWQEDPTTKSITSPTGVSSGTSNVGYPTNVDTAKRMLLIAKALRDETSELAKAMPVALEKLFTPIEKAGEAAGMLEKIAALFGVSATNDVGDYRGLAWRVEDVIRAIESAAAMDKAMATMAAAFGSTTAPAPAPAGEVESAAKSVTKSDAGTTAKSEDDFPALGSSTNADGWPSDMNASRSVTKAVSKKPEEEIRF